MSTYAWSMNGLPGKVGPVTGGDGTSAQIRLSQDSTNVVQDGHARYTEPVTRGQVFACVNSAAQALSLTGTTTYTGMVVYNPAGSGKNLVLLEAMYSVTVAITGVGAVILFSQALATAPPTLTVTNVSTSPFCTNLGGSGASVAKVASSCTLAANPIFLRPLISIPWITPSGSSYVAKDEIGGSISIAPGCGVGFVAVTTATTGIGFLSWEEVPLVR